jgi:oligopeptide transport system permease protein
MSRPEGKRTGSRGARKTPRPVVISWLVLALLALAALAGLATQSPGESRCCAAPPSPTHFLGTAAHGVDLGSAVAQGLGTSALICLAATVLALLFGLAWGGTAALLKPRLENGLMRVVDVLAVAPYTLFVVALVVVMRAARPNLGVELAFLVDTRTLLVVAVATIEWITVARVVHGQLAALRRRPFVEAARSLGVSRLKVLVVHVVPHAVGPLAAYGVLALPSALAAEGFLSFVGFGVEAPRVSLGTLIADGARAMSVAPLTFVLPAGVLVAATVALHVVGAHLRDTIGGAGEAGRG